MEIVDPAEPQVAAPTLHFVHHMETNVVETHSLDFPV
jgi:hypothetical protein